MIPVERENRDHPYLPDRRFMMKSGLIFTMVFLTAAVAGAGENSRIQIPPLGFHTMDLTKEFWASIDDAHHSQRPA